MNVWLFTFFWIAEYFDFAEGVYCYYYRSFQHQAGYMWCSYACCGNSFHRHCCSLAGVVVASVFGGLVVLAIAITLVTCLCCNCCGRQAILVSRRKALISPIRQPEVAGNYQSISTPGTHDSDGPPVLVHKSTSTSAEKQPLI